MHQRLDESATLELGSSSAFSPSFQAPLSPKSTGAGVHFQRMTDSVAPPQETLTRPVNILQPNVGAVNNRITTALYTWYTFPTIGFLELLYPWNKFANFYFFFVGLMQMTPASLTRGQPASWATLTFIMICEMFFKGKEDLERYRGDKATNTAEVEILSAEELAQGASPNFVRRTWAHVRVGDVVRVSSRESFPADLLLLRGSDPPGQCWVNTKPLDGETDTKLRLAPKAIASLLGDEASCAPEALCRLLRGQVRCEEPNDKVNDITAQLCLEGLPPALLNEDNFLLRGCQLRNTAWVLGLVVTCGTHTKINFSPAAYEASLARTTWAGRAWGTLVSIFGGTGPKPKTGTTARMVNFDIMGVVTWLIVICVGGGIVYILLDAQWADGALWYLGEAPTDSFLLMATRFFLICYQFVPISLYVSMMMFQTICRYFLINDITAYDEVQDEPCQVRQMSLLDELGQVSHIFSDKTGTLTSNHMEFRRCFLFTPKGQAYGCGETAISKSLRERREGGGANNGEGAPSPSAGAGGSNGAAHGRVAEWEGTGARPPSQNASLYGGAELSEMYDGLTPLDGAAATNAARRGSKGGGSGSDPVISREPLPGFAGCKPTTATYCNYEEEAGKPSLLRTLSSAGTEGAMARELMLAMAVNHSVLLEKISGKLELSASSPDEQAFVAAAEFFGLEYVARDAERGVLTILDKQSGLRHEVEVLEVFPYESSRKRMSVIVQLPPALVEAVGGGEPVRLYTKGADSVLLADGPESILEAGSNGSDAASRSQLDALLYEWADIALRTLVFAKRELPNFGVWHAAYRAANEDPAEVRKLKADQPNEISRLQAQIECELTLQGATAIEDKLQEGVPEILADLRTAGIKVWMLTGDKVGTAKNIATACNILPQSCELLEITTETFPVLAEVKTSELLAASKTLDAALKGEVLHGSYVAGSGADEGQQQQQRRRHPSEGGRSGLSGALLGPIADRWHRMRQTGGDATRWQYMHALQHQTELLDSLYPELTQVRAALADHRTLMIEAMNARSRGRGGGFVNPAEAAPREFCLVLDEKAIEYCGLLCKEVLAAVGNGSRAVVACRARKDQKAQLLNLIKEGVPTSCCLAIGDGANDVAMIQAGQIGVGIIGKEGMQAVNSSDFAIGQFRFLRCLLLVHGRFAYRRTALFCYYMFYKNIANVLAMYLYTLVALASGERLFVQVYLEVYNIVFTALPIICFCVFDQDVDKHTSAYSPKLYTPGIHRIYYTHVGFVTWMAESVLLAFVSVYVPALALGYPGWSLAVLENGDPGVSALSLFSMGLVCVNVNLRLAIEMHSWHFCEHLFMWGSIISIQLACIIFSFVWPPSFIPASFDWSSLYFVAWHVYGTPVFWLSTMLVIVIVLAPRTLGKSYDTMSFGRVSARRRTRLILERKRDEQASVKESMCNSQMALPAPREMHRYRQSTVDPAAAGGHTRPSCCVSRAQHSAASAEAPSSSLPNASPLPPPAASLSEINPVVDPAMGAPPGRTRSSFAFSNNDRSSLSVLASFGRVSLSRRPTNLD